MGLLGLLLDGMCIDRSENVCSWSACGCMDVGEEKERSVWLDVWSDGLCLGEGEEKERLWEEEKEEKDLSEKEEELLRQEEAWINHMLSL